MNNAKDFFHVTSKNNLFSNMYNCLNIQYMSLSNSLYRPQCSRSLLSFFRFHGTRTPITTPKTVPQTIPSASCVQNTSYRPAFLKYTFKL
jgi:hypothetical protein